MYILCAAVDGSSSAKLTRQRQLLVVEVHGDDRSAAKAGTHDGTHANHAAADDQHRVGIRHLTAIDSVEAHTHRLDQRDVLRRQALGWNHLLPRYSDVFTHGTMALNAQRLIVLAGVETTTTAAGAVAAGRVRIHGDKLSCLQISRHALAYPFYGGTNLMTRDDWRQRQCIAAAVRVEVRTAEADIVDAQQHLAI